MADKAWLKSLKPGDEVAYDTGWTVNSWAIDRVAKVTPTGQIRTESGFLFKDGRYRYDKFRTYYLHPVDNKVKDFLRRTEIKIIIDNTKFSKLSTAALEQILAIIEDDTRKVDEQQ